MSKKDRFENFIRERDQNKDWANYVSNDGLSLVKQRIVKQCEFPRSTFYQDKTIKQRLSQLEARLRGRGVLKSEDASNTHHTQEEVAAEVRLSDFNARLDALQMRIRALSMLIDNSRNIGLNPNGD